MAPTSRTLCPMPLLMVIVTVLPARSRSSVGRADDWAEVRAGEAWDSWWAANAAGAGTRTPSAIASAAAAAAKDLRVVAPALDGPPNNVLFFKNPPHG
jgi:hypothetical protein